MDKEVLFRFGVSSSLVIFGFNKKELILLIKKKDKPPFQGAPILPTSYVHPHQSVDDRADETLKELFGNDQNSYTEQLKAFSHPYRNPVGRVINIAQYVVLDHDHINKEIPGCYTWCSALNIPELAFDHNSIVQYARERLKRRVKRRPIGFHLLPEEFTFREIHTLYEQALSKELDVRNFRKKLFNSKLLIDTEKSIRVESNFKPSTLYAFNNSEYDKLSLKGYDFSFF